MLSNLPFDRSLLASLITVGLAGCAATAGTLPAGAPAAAPTATAAAPVPTAQPTPPGTPRAAPAAAASGPAGAASAPPAAPRPPGSPTPFAEVVKDATSKEGLLTLWTKDDKTWLEIPKAWVGKPLFLGNSLASGLGEGFVLPGLMGREQVVVLRRAGNNLQLVARSLHARAPAGTPLASAVADSYSDSLLAAAPLAAAPHPTRESLLVDAAALFGGDLMGLQTQLEANFRLPYALDRGNSTIERARTTPQGTTLTFRSHFMVPKMPAPPVLTPGAPPPNPAMLPNPPRSLPDARSLFVNVAYTLTPLPEQPMKPRLADPRVGYFTEAYTDLGDDTTETNRTHLVHRWRLEKKEPGAAVSEPKQPIRVVMDRNIPEKWRTPVRDGILEWNKAYERAGWRNAVVVEQQAADADDTVFEAPRVLAVRWFAAEGPGALAVGPSQADPRTGEILRGAAIIPENWVRFFRNQATDVEPRLTGAPAPEFAERFMACTYAADKLEQAAFGFELLSERGAFDPKGPEAERYIAQSLKDVTMHEVGHALGLRHNFRASIGITPQQLRDPAFTATRGVSNSIMDYNALNLPLRGEAVADYHMTTLGAYDYWAIEYGYRDFDASEEAAALKRLASQSEKDPALAYGTDEDAYGTDPQINHRDLGNDPLAFARREIKLARELWTLTQARELPAESDYTVYRRNLQRGLNNMQAAVGMVAKYVGGAYTSRQLAGAGQAVTAPVPGTKQREALDLLVTEVFASSSFRFDPKFMSRLGVNQLDRFGRGRFQVATDYSLPAAVSGIQRSALDALMSEGLAARLADAEVKVADTRTLLGYAEVQQRLADAAWGELKGSTREIDSLRRNLQREHLKRLAGALVRPSSAAAADVRGVHRMVALKLEAELKRAAAAPGWNDTARAHLAESAQTLAEALRAPLMKQGV